MNQQTPLVISELIAANRIQLNLQAHSREDVLKELVVAVPQISDLPEAQETLFKALIEREKLHSTGIGDGIALPHARNALVGLVDEPVIIFARHKTGVQFSAIDGKPAHLFFLLVSPTVTQHLGMLAKISRILRQPRVRDRLLAAERPEQILEAIREGEKNV